MVFTVFMFHHTNGSSGVYDQDLCILDIWPGVTSGAQADRFLQLKHKTRLKGKVYCKTQQVELTHFI